MLDQGSLVNGPVTGSLSHILIALFVILVTARVLGRILGALGQPQVIGEITAGILLGPTFLGRFWPEGAAFLLPPSVAPSLGMLAQLGVVLYMFLVGLEIRLDSLGGKLRETVLIAQAGIFAPFVLSGFLAYFLYPRFAAGDSTLFHFALFVGVASSATALPVLARIMSFQGMQQSQLGSLALTCAAAADVIVWCLLALVVEIDRSRPAWAVFDAALAILYVFVMLGLVRPGLARVLARYDAEHSASGLMSFLLIALIASALCSEVIGLHAIFGAFLFGMIVPRQGTIAVKLIDKFEVLVTMLLLPAFFAFTGMKTRIDLVSSGELWVYCGLIIAVASAGKFGGTLVAARWFGLGWRDSAALGTIMNAKGLMELIVLDIGLELEVITPTLHAMMVIMALATTFATTPLLQLILRGVRPTDASAPHFRESRQPEPAHIYSVSDTESFV